MFLGLILSAMDSSVIATALVPIGHYFDDFITLQWLVLSYLLTYLGMFSCLDFLLGSWSWLPG